MNRAAGKILASVPQRRHAPRGFSLVELLVVLFVLCVLIGILLPAMTRVRRSADSVNCISNLRQIAMGFHQYASDNSGHLPDPLAADVSWETTLCRYLRPVNIYLCPADGELAASIGSSYDWRDTGDPATTLVGCPLTDAHFDTVLVYDSLPNWHAKGKMNAARADGSAVQMDTQACLANLMTPLRAVWPPDDRLLGPRR